MRVIVALGDSTTAGTPGWQSPLEHPPAGAGNEQSQYGYWLQRAHPEWTILNRGVNGERSDQMLDRFDRDVLAADPAVVIVIAGVNDIYQGRTAVDVITNLQCIYERARAAGIRVVAGSIVPFNTATAGQNAAMRKVNEWIRRRPDQDPNVVFVDTRAAVAAPDNPDLLAASPDGLHPSVDGYRAMAEAVVSALESLLPRSRPR
jgi:lysophospholipase L1-like esterase